MSAPVDPPSRTHGWTDTFRSPSPCSELDCSADEGDVHDGRAWIADRVTLDDNLRFQLDMSSREDHAAKFNHTPFTIAKMHSASTIAHPPSEQRIVHNSHIQTSMGGRLPQKGGQQQGKVQSSCVTEYLKSTKSSSTIIKNKNTNEFISANILTLKDRFQSLPSSSKPIKIPRPKSKASAPIQFGRLPPNVSSRSSEFPIISALQRQGLLPNKSLPASSRLGNSEPGKVERRNNPMELEVLKVKGDYAMPGGDGMTGENTITGDNMMFKDVTLMGEDMWQEGRVGDDLNENLPDEADARSDLVNKELLARNSTIDPLDALSAGPPEMTSQRRSRRSDTTGPPLLDQENLTIERDDSPASRPLPIDPSFHIASQPQHSKSPLLYVNTERGLINDTPPAEQPPTFLLPPRQAPQTFRSISSYNPPTVPKHAPVGPGQVEDLFIEYAAGEEDVRMSWNEGGGRPISQGLANQVLQHPEGGIAAQRLSKPMNLNISPPQKRYYASSFSKSHDRSSEFKRTFVETARAKAKAAKEKRTVHGMEVGSVMGVIEEDLFKSESEERSRTSGRPHRNAKPRSQADFYHTDLSTRSNSSEVEWTTIPSPKRSTTSRYGNSVPMRRSALFKLPGRLFGDPAIQKNVERPKRMRSSMDGDEVKIVPMKRKMTLFTPTPMGVKKSNVEVGGGRRSIGAESIAVDEGLAIDLANSKAKEQESSEAGAHAFGSDSATEVESRRRKTQLSTEELDDIVKTLVPVTSLFETILDAEYHNPCEAPCQLDDKKVRCGVERTRERSPATRAYVDDCTQVKMSDHLEEDGEDMGTGML